MLCEHKKSALTEAAATGQVPASLQAQLASCESCRTVFAEEQALFAAVDLGVRAAANAEISTSLVPRLRNAVDVQRVAAPSRLFAWSSLAAACAVAAVAIFLVRLPHTSTSPVVTIPMPVASEPQSSAQSLQPVVSDPRVRATVPATSRAAARPVVLQAKAGPKHFNEPRVIVPPDEREAYQQFIAVLQRDEGIARALAAPQPANPPNASMAAAPLEIANLKIKLMDPRDENKDSAAEPEESGAGEKLHQSQ